MPPGNESTKFPEQHVLEIHNISKTNTQLKNKHKYYFSDAVETCVPWAVNKTQQIDLAFNIFFMVYFFIRVTHNNTDLASSSTLYLFFSSLLPLTSFGSCWNSTRLWTTSPSHLLLYLFIWTGIIHFVNFDEIS